MLKKFLSEFQYRINKTYDNSEIVNALKKYSNQESIDLMNFMMEMRNIINFYKDRLNDMDTNSPIELKHCLESFKLNKIRKEKTRNKIKKIVKNIIDDMQIIIKDNFLEPMISAQRETDNIKYLKEHLNELLPIITEHREKIDFELDKVITDYNNSPTNFWARNRDKIIVPIVVSIITTLMTIYMSKYLISLAKYLFNQP